MPVTQNLSQTFPGLNPSVQSVRAWLFPGPGFNYPQPPTAMSLLQAEVPANQAHFVVYEGFTGKNATGASIGRGSVDTGDQTALQAYRASTLEALLVAAFPAPGPD